MQIQVGSFRYEILSRPGPIPHPEGGECHGVAYPDLQRIEFSMAAPAAKRMAVVWHEIGHLLKADFDIRGHDDRKMDEETCCNWLGLSMSMMSPMDLLRLHVYVMQGIDAPAAMLHPGLSHPVPVLHITRPS